MSNVQALSLIQSGVYTFHESFFVSLFFSFDQRNIGFEDISDFAANYSFCLFVFLVTYLHNSYAFFSKGDRNGAGQNYFIVNTENT